MAIPLEAAARAGSQVVERPGGRWAQPRVTGTDEIVRVGRRLVAERGADAVALRAIAREIGVSAPTLYHYVGSRQELLGDIVDDISRSLTAELRAAIAGLPERDLGRVFVVAGFALRNWALAHRHEYELLFTLQPAGQGIGAGGGHAEPFGAAFLTLVLSHWDHRSFSALTGKELRSLRYGPLDSQWRFSDPRLSSGAIRILLDCWARLQGFIALEVFGHLTFALDDPAPLFDLTLADVARRLTQP